MKSNDILSMNSAQLLSYLNTRNQKIKEDSQRDIEESLLTDNIIYESIESSLPRFNKSFATPSRRDYSNKSILQDVIDAHQNIVNKNSQKEQTPEKSLSEIISYYKNQYQGSNLIQQNNQKKLPEYAVDQSLLKQGDTLQFSANQEIEQNQSLNENEFSEKILIQENRYEHPRYQRKEESSNSENFAKKLKKEFQNNESQFIIKNEIKSSEKKALQFQKKNPNSTLDFDETQKKIIKTSYKTTEKSFQLFPDQYGVKKPNTLEEHTTTPTKREKINKYSQKPLEELCFHSNSKPTPIIKQDKKNDQDYVDLYFNIQFVQKEIGLNIADLTDLIVNKIKQNKNIQKNELIDLYSQAQDLDLLSDQILQIKKNSFGQESINTPIQIKMPQELQLQINGDKNINIERIQKIKSQQDIKEIISLYQNDIKLDSDQRLEEQKETKQFQDFQKRITIDFQIK